MASFGTSYLNIVRRNYYRRPTIWTTGWPEIISKTVVPTMPIIAKRPFNISAAEKIKTKIKIEEKSSR